MSAIREFIWEDGFTPYWATLDGVTLTEYADGEIERQSVVVRRTEWDGHAGAADYALTDDFSVGAFGGDDAVWIDGEGYALVPVMGDLSAAVAIVVADQRQGSGVDADTDAELIEHVRETLIIPGRPAVPGGFHLVGDPDADDVRAYVAVLAASADSLAAVVCR